MHLVQHRDGRVDVGVEGRHHVVLGHDWGRCGRLGVESRPVVGRKPVVEEEESGDGLELRNHVSRTPDRQKVEVVGVSDHVASDLSLAVQCPRSPWLYLLKSHGACPELTAIVRHTGVGVAIEDQNAVAVGHQPLVDRPDILTRRHIARPPVPLVPVPLDVQRSLHLLPVEPRVHSPCRAALIVVQRTTQRTALRVWGSPLRHCVASEREGMGLGDALGEVCCCCRCGCELVAGAKTFVVYVVDIKAADFRLHLIDQALACRAVGVVSVEKLGKACRLKSKTGGGGELAMTVQDLRIPVHVIDATPALRVCPHTPIANHHSPQAGDRPRVVQYQLSQRRHIHPRIRFTRYVKIIARKLGICIEKVDEEVEVVLCGDGVVPEGTLVWVHTV
mmetsp:Transcript_43311/g.108212  ORF Transcript_43311/g.108212 Transcript_43311/m.108212 type:complete len:390 (-) Transcript_43311:440-1609(-)